MPLLMKKMGNFTVLNHDEEGANNETQKLEYVKEFQFEQR